MLFSLWLLQSGYKITHSGKIISYVNNAIIINDRKTLHDAFLHVKDLESLIKEATKEIQSGARTFESKKLQPFYDFFDNNSIPVKANSQTKSDVIILNPEPTGVSIKSFLGSNPSILNANMHWSGFVYELPEIHKIKVGIPISQVSKDTLANSNFVGYADDKFEEKFGFFTELPKMVLSWKSAATPTSNFSYFLKENQPGIDKCKEFVQILMQGNKDDKPSFLGIVHKDGSFDMVDHSDSWRQLYFDAPSRSRHQYGYVYKHGDALRFMIVIGLRIKDY